MDSGQNNPFSFPQDKSSLVDTHNRPSLPSASDPNTCPQTQSQLHTQAQNPPVPHDSKHNTSRCKLNLDLSHNLAGVDANDTAIPDNKEHHDRTHKRGTENSLFNSDSTLVDHTDQHSIIPPRTSSASSDISNYSSSTCRTNSDSLNLLPIVISEESPIIKSENYFDTNTPLTMQVQNSPNSEIPVLNSSLSYNNHINTNTPHQSDTQEPDYFGQNINSSIKGFSNRSMNLLGHRTSKSETFTLKLNKRLDPKSINQLNLLQEEDGSSSSSTVTESETQSSISEQNNGCFNFTQSLPSAPPTSKANFSYLNDSTGIDSTTSSSPISPDFNVSLFKRLNTPLTTTATTTTITTPDQLNSSLLPLRTSFNLKSKSKSQSNHLKLPENVQILKLENAESQILNWSSSIGHDSLSNLLIIDLRPFHDYCKFHIINSINICLPSTLLKRSTFTLQKCIQTLTQSEKQLFDLYTLRNNDELPNVLFYDDYNSTNDNISPSIFHLASKFIQSPIWNSKLFILEGGFEKFNKKFTSSTFPTIQDSLNVEFSNNPDLSSTSLNSAIFSPQLITTSPQTITSPQSSMHTSMLSTSSPSIMNNSNNSIGLSRLVLPEENTPIFKTKNYDEIIINEPDLSIHLSSNLIQSEINKLPNWLSNIFGNDLGSQKLTEKFNKLQIEERLRLKHALTKTNTSNSISTAHSPIISSGVELGDKNRYKDIFIYEHARVKLNNIKDNSSNYINASYIKYPNTNLNYIATQGPLKDTIGDFWKMVYDNNVPIIFSLTAQSENQVEKCAPFWESGIFYTNSEKVVVELLEEIDDLQLSAHKNTNCISRRLLVTIGDRPKLEVLQLHMVSWPDFGIVICEEDILSLVSLKRYITKQLGSSNNPVLVYCSAGCGRTGSFCVIDTCIDVLFNNKRDGKTETNDLIYDITSVFRSQRVFMVQTLRQYMLIYDSIIKFIKMNENNAIVATHDIVDDQGLVDWEIKDPGIFKRFLKSQSHSHSVSQQM